MHKVYPGLRRRELSACTPPVDYVCSACGTIAPEPERGCPHCRVIVERRRERLAEFLSSRAKTAN